MRWFRIRWGRAWRWCWDNESAAGVHPTQYPKNGGGGGIRPRRGRCGWRSVGDRREPTHGPRERSPVFKTVTRIPNQTRADQTGLTGTNYGRPLRESSFCLVWSRLVWFGLLGVPPVYHGVNCSFSELSPRTGPSRVLLGSGGRDPKAATLGSRMRRSTETTTRQVCSASKTILVGRCSVLEVHS
jgi:hypothetical protein